VGTRRAYLHVGLDDGSGDVLGDALGAYAHALLDLRVRRAGDPAATLRAVLDVLGRPAGWDLDPDELDGAWASLVEKARKGRDTIVLSEPLLASAPPARARALVESLDGFAVHAVVTARAPQPWAASGAGSDLGDVLPRWADAVGAANRVHVLLGDDAATWKALGKVAGFGTASLRVDRSTPTGPTGPRPVDPDLARAWRELLGSSSYDVVGDLSLLDAPADAPDTSPTAALADAHAELARLRRHNTDLAERLEKAERKKRKLKRRLSKLT
jgi:hypothetical protein